MDERPMTPRSEGCRKGRKNQDPLLHKKYFSKYRTIKKLGEGSFGKVYKAEYNNEYYAIKFEDRVKGQNLLETEANIMSYLKGPNIPSIKSYGYSGEFNILVMQLMGKSLEEIFNKLQKFSVKTTSLLGYQMVSILQYIHDRHIIHRDIKPDNFVMGLGKYNADLYILDFGLAKKYRSSKTLEQCPYIKKKKLTGTARYASIHALEEMEQSRRDDLESVGYILMYFLRGNLPWQGLKIKSKEDRYKKILDKKKEVSSEQLCQNFPEEFKEYLEYTKNLEYTEEPKYEKIKMKFKNLIIKKLKDNFDFIYDWTTQHDIKMRQINYQHKTKDKEEKIEEKNILKQENNKDINIIVENNIPRIVQDDEIDNDIINMDGNKENKENKELKEKNDNNVFNEKVNSKCCTMYVYYYLIFFIVFNIWG